ncbi:hypothetical protein [Nannocystis sp.]|uniref:hypothetical protein n=1 Tax=Nannocystis sp. TaxID=1962667 RepID=UPI0025FF4CA8|nr:hypothetical protein [Nannocystis sp.]MBK7827003.1 hypothetical protein [Nannocystis sp.]
MPGLYAPPKSAEPPSPARELLLRSGAFDVVGLADKASATRRRRLPPRGLLRLLIPRTRVQLHPGGRWTVRPDGIATGALVVFLGGIVTELTMDRATYPRDYPPAFVPCLALIYVTLLVIELRITRRAVLRALASPGSAA